METVAEKRRKEMISMFLDKYKRISSPFCWQCRTPVNSFSIDAEPRENWLIAICKCHGDTTEYKIRFDKAMTFNNLVIPWAFKPGLAQRVDGKLTSEMNPNTTRKYEGKELEPVSDEEKRDILEIPKDKPLGGYAS